MGSKKEKSQESRITVPPGMDLTYHDESRITVPPGSFTML
jgi:hypothetical protein